MIREFEDGDCIIDNQIVKTQWINNFFISDIVDFNYIDLYTSLNGDLISVITTYEWGRDSRVFFHLKGENGRGYFSNYGEETPFLIMSNNAEGREHINIFTLKLNNNIDDQEYIMSISTYNEDVELYELNEMRIYSNLVEGGFQVEYV